MRLQLATFESLLSLSFSLSLLCAIAYCISGYTANFSASNRELMWSYTAYDFVRQATENTSMQTCVSSFIINGSSCIINYLDEYAGIYGFENMSLVSVNGGSTGASLSNRTGSCFPFHAGNKYAFLCLEAGA